MRASGILLPVSSLPSPYGIGSMGAAARDFVDFLADAGQSCWQILPVGPTGYGDSPYQSFSAFAGNPYFIDLDTLVQQGLLQPQEIGDNWAEDLARVDYGLLFARRLGVLQCAARRMPQQDPAYTAFCQAEAYWLNDYALFMALKEHHGQVGFAQWPHNVRTRQPGALEEARAQLAPAYEFWRRVQYLFFTQWDALKAYANQKGVQIIGDTPIYVSPDSSDLWANPQLFQVDDDMCPTAVAGVPPDGYSPTGQLWGNPLYHWPAHKKSGYAWWLRRLAHTARLYDINRIDHFRGFAGYYAIPAGDKTAQNGVWRPGPGRDFLRAVRRSLPGIRLIAEDLGFLTPEVRDLLRYSGYPGMKVLQFAYDTRPENDYLPYHYLRHAVVYTGTHDNATTEEWCWTAPQAEVRHAQHYMGVEGEQNLTDAFIRTALSSVADMAVIPLQDWLHLGADARINTPSTLGGGNWRWRLLPGQATRELAEHIKQCTALYGRMPQQEEALRVLAQIEGPLTREEAEAARREAESFEEARQQDV